MNDKNKHIDHVNWKKNPDVVVRNIEGEILLLNLETGVYYGLNKTGSEIWELLDKYSSIESINAEIAQKYQGSEREVLSCIRELFSDMKSENLVQEQDDIG